MTDFDARLVPHTDRFDVYRDEAAPVFEARTVDDAVSFYSATRDYFVGDMIVSRLWNDVHLMRRDHRHLSDGCSDWINIQLFVSGGSRGVIDDDRGLALGPSNMGVLDLSRPFTTTLAASDLIAVCVPRDRIASAGSPFGKTPVLRGVATTTAAGCSRMSSCEPGGTSPARPRRMDRCSWIGWSIRSSVAEITQRHAAAIGPAYPVD